MKVLRNHSKWLFCYSECHVFGNILIGQDYLIRGEASYLSTERLITPASPILLVPLTMRSKATKTSSKFQ